LQYYIGSFQRQEREEQRKSEKKRRKLESAQRASNKDNNITKPKIEESINISLAEGPDSELDNLALLLQESLKKNEQDLYF